MISRLEKHWLAALVLDIAEAFRANARARIAGHPNHLHTLNTLRKADSRAPITLFAVAEAVTERVMFDIEAGDWILSTNVSVDANDNVNGKGGLVDCEVYNDEASALARQVVLLALADSNAVPDPADATGFKH
jgi:hypothetical protein